MKATYAGRNSLWLGDDPDHRVMRSGALIDYDPKKERLAFWNVRNIMEERGWYIEVLWVPGIAYCPVWGKAGFKDFMADWKDAKRICRERRA